jgi:hypothetical protein
VGVFEAQLSMGSQPGDTSRCGPEMSAIISKCIFVNARRLGRECGTPASAAESVQTGSSMGWSDRKTSKSRDSADATVIVRGSVCKLDQSRDFEPGALDTAAGGGSGTALLARSADIGDPLSTAAAAGWSGGMMDYSTAAHGRSQYTPQTAHDTSGNRRFAVAEQSQLGSSFGARSHIMPQFSRSVWVVFDANGYDDDERSTMRAYGADADMFYIPGERSEKYRFR